jgi:LDH2 family malate/lactate/ureidoglycolate dehydrogenase|tara:strand:- start:17652 stop:18740 length:1089 start_codon:yes stop_codon:yes gene_type:complete
MSMIIQHEALRAIVANIYEKLGVPEQNARTAAEIAVASDLRGVDSHGVGMLPRKVDYMCRGLIEPNPQIKIDRETPATALLDGGNGLGAVAGKRAMELCIQKAKAVGAGFVTVHDSNHYGIAGYYSMMALEHDMIGISTTNTTPLVVPTFGRKAMLGTNPISMAAPAGQERPFVLDMATSVVPSGKMAVYKRQDKNIPPGWAIDIEDQPMTDPDEVSKMLYSRSGGGLLPLGGEGEEFGGHKGYGLTFMADILAGALSGAAFGSFVYPSKDGKQSPGNVGHFFGALSIEAFRPLDEFKRTMDEMIRDLKETPKVPGQERIYIHGEKEFEIEAERRRSGIPLHDQVAATLKELAQEMEVEWVD